MRLFRPCSWHQYWRVLYPILFIYLSDHDYSAVAVMLGRMQMSVEDALGQFSKMALQASLASKLVVRLSIPPPISLSKDYFQTGESLCKT
jgi:hypothetical protein